MHMAVEWGVYLWCAFPNLQNCLAIILCHIVTLIPFDQNGLCSHYEKLAVVLAVHHPIFIDEYDDDDNEIEYLGMQCVMEVATRSPQSSVAMVAISTAKMTMMIMTMMMLADISIVQMTMTMEVSAISATKMMTMTM